MPPLQFWIQGAAIAALVVFIGAGYSWYTAARMGYENAARTKTQADRIAELQDLLNKAAALGKPAPAEPQSGEWLHAYSLWTAQTKTTFSRLYSPGEAFWLFSEPDDINVKLPQGITDHAQERWRLNAYVTRLNEMINRERGKPPSAA